jgi:hypothetical protein
MDQPQLPPEPWQERARARQAAHDAWYAEMRAEQAALRAQVQALSARAEVVCDAFVEEYRKWLDRHRRED